MPPKALSRLTSGEWILSVAMTLSRSHTNDPGQFRDALEMTDVEIRDRLAAIRALLIEHGVDPLALPSPRGNGRHQ